MYKYFDAHCDTMLKMYERNIGFNSPELMVNAHNLDGYERSVQVFALFNNGEINEEQMMDCFRYFEIECKKLAQFISVCTTAEETNKSPLSAVLAIEGLGNQADFTIESVGRFYDVGVRFMSLCWNNDNQLCGGCEGKGTGLTELGRKTLAEMEMKKIILDVSHMSDASFWESFENYSLPICATHSNSRFVHNHRRNLTDEQFLAIKECNGVCGINFYPPFLCNGESDINDIIKHIEHFLSLGGEDNIGIGSDFDGIDSTPCGLENSAHFYKLFDTLLSLNYSEEIVEKIAFGNFKNFFERFTVQRISV